MADVSVNVSAASLSIWLANMRYQPLLFAFSSPHSASSMKCLVNSTARECGFFFSICPAQKLPTGQMNDVRPSAAQGKTFWRSSCSNGEKKNEKLGRPSGEHKGNFKNGKHDDGNGRFCWRTGFPLNNNSIQYESSLSQQIACASSQRTGELPDLFLIGSISKRLFECKGGDSSFFAKRPYRSTLAVYGSSVGDKKHLARTHARAADHPSLCMHATLKDGEKKKRNNVA